MRQYGSTKFQWLKESSEAFHMAASVTSDQLWKNCNNLPGIIFEFKLSSK